MENGSLPSVPFVFSARIRPSPFFERMVAGLSGVTTYNHMVLPVSYEGTDADYRNLTEGVTVWDVGAERQVEITGPDAAALVQYLVTRDVDQIEPGVARYTLLCQEDGGILNDPVILRLASDHFWLSLADADMLLWAKGIAHGSSWSVGVREPDVSPLQIQGPRAFEVASALFGPEILELGFFRFVEFDLDGVPLVVARTGWSGERGFEVFLRDGDRGAWLWDRVLEAGGPFGIRPGAPNNIRRIEVGLLSHRADMNETMNPFELGLGRLVEFETDADFIGRAALERIASVGPVRRRTGIVIDGDPIVQGPIRWWPVRADGRVAGFVTSAVWSPSQGANIGFVMLDAGTADDAPLSVEMPGGERPARPASIPFVAPRYR